MTTIKNQYFRSITILLLSLIRFNNDQFHFVTATNVYVPIFNNENILNNNLSFNISQQLMGTSIGTITSGLASSSSDTSSTTNEQQYHHKFNSKPNNHKVPSSSFDIDAFSIHELNRNLEIKLKSIRNTELGIPFIQEIFDTMEFVAIDRNDTKIVTEMVQKLTKKLNKAIRAITDASIKLQSSLRMNDEQDEDDWATIFLQTTIHPCPYNEQRLDQHYDKNQIEIKNYMKTTEHFIETDNVNFTINQQLTESLTQVNYSLHNFKQLYFLSKDDFANDYNCHLHSDNHHLRFVL